MHDYQSTLLAQLCEYAQQQTGSSLSGEFRGKKYGHILPPIDRKLNLLEPFRERISQHIQDSHHIKLHQFFHHLNSSQAFAFNLFFPYFSDSIAARTLCGELGEAEELEHWEFEHVPDPREGTNVDVAWRTKSGRWTYCEVKLTESGFGTAEPDARHAGKLAQIYAPRLKDIVSEDLLTPARFFSNYQILRNISLLYDSADSRVLFLFPRENEVLGRQLASVLDEVSDRVRARIVVRHVEQVIGALSDAPNLEETYKRYATALAEKYLIGGALNERA